MPKQRRRDPQTGAVVLGPLPARTPRPHPLSPNVLGRHEKQDADLPAARPCRPSCSGYGLFDGIAVRAPVPTGSIADITFLTSRPTSVEEVNQVLTDEAQTERYAGILGVSRDPLVSSDIIADPRASIVDLELTKVVDGDLVKVMSWYDNEWGYANQVVREARTVLGQGPG